MTLLCRDAFKDWHPTFEMAYHGSRKHLYCHHLLFEPDFITGKISYIVQKTYEPDKRFDTLEDAIDYYNNTRYEDVSPG